MLDLSHCMHILPDFVLAMFVSYEKSYLWEYICLALSLVLSAALLGQTQVLLLI